MITSLLGGAIVTAKKPSSIWTPEKRREMSDRQKAQWTPERRALWSQIGKSAYASLPSSEKAIRAVRGREAYLAKYPERRATYDRFREVVEAGDRPIPTCPTCIKPMRPRFDWAAEKEIAPIKAWKCWPCGVEEIRSWTTR